MSDEIPYTYSGQSMMDLYQHPAFPSPPPDAVLWRYLDFEKFDWLVRNSRLFMPSVQQFLGDPLEGTASLGHLEWWRSLERGAPSNEQREVIKKNKELLDRFAQKFRPNYFVSCWHLNTLENAEMWRCYTSKSESVAIVTTYEALRTALPAYVDIGTVRYIDYSNERFPSLNMCEYIMHKNLEFSFECEVRAVAFPPATEELGASHFHANSFESEASDGVYIFAPQVDIKSIIHRVVLHPEVSYEFSERILSICRESGLPRPVSSIFQSR